MDIRQSANYSKYMHSLGWQVEKVDQTSIFIRHLPIFSKWSVIKVQRPEKINFGKLDEIARRHHALFVKAEPNSSLLSTYKEMTRNGFKKDNWPLLPSKTLVLNLKGLTLENLPKDTRYEIRKAQKNDLRIEKTLDIELFYKLLQETMKIGKWNIPIHHEVVSLWNSFQPGNSQLLFVYCQERPIAACLLIWEGEMAHYMYAALNNEGRRHGAAYLLLWEVIQFCQLKKIKYLDFEGIYDDRYAKNTKHWQGFTKFKMGWGGNEMEYSGSYTKYFNFVAKMLFSISF